MCIAFTAYITPCFVTQKLKKNQYCVEYGTKVLTLHALAQQYWGKH